MTSTLLPLFVAIPLIAAALAVVVRHVVALRLLTALTPLLTAAGAVWLLVTHATTPVLAENVGGFAPGISIPLVSDTFTALMLLVTSVTTLACVWFMVATGEDRYRLVPALILLLHAGVNGAFLTGDLFNLFVFIEVMLLPSYALIAVTGTWRRLGIGRTFVIINLLTSTLLLIGVGLVYATAGSVNLAVLARAALESPQTNLSVALVLFALAVKGAVVPAHTWLPRVYPATSASVMALFSALHTKVAVYALYRITATLYEGSPPWLLLLVVLVCLTLVVGAYGSFGEHVLRRALSWQMVAGVGHILVGLALFTQLSLTAGIFYLMHHIVTMGALLLGSGAIEQTYGSGRYARLAGIARRDVVFTVGYALAMLSLIGMPPSTGFLGKLGLVQASAGVGGALQVTFVAVICVAALGSLVAMQRLWVGVFWGPDMKTYRPDSPETGRADRQPLPDTVRITPALYAPAFALIALQLVMFVGAGPLMDLTGRAASGLIDLAPYIEAVLG